MRILGVDPGSPHVGVSEWEDKTCVRSWETTPESLAHRIIHTPFVYAYDVICAEAYVPQGGFGNSGPGVETIKLLGLLEWHARLATGTEMRLTTRLDRSAALKRLKAIKYEFHDGGSSGHARDSEAVVVSAMRWSVKDLRSS